MRVDQPLNMTPYFVIAADGTGPQIKLETALPGPHSWGWEIKWKTFSQTGGMSTIGNSFSFQPEVGGTLIVRVTGDGKTFTFTAPIVGRNPSVDAIRAYVASKSDSDGFLDIILHESKGQHFNARGEPIESFDHGYGLCQLTKPVPTMDQIWNWKSNIDAGLLLFAEKRRSARNYLSKHGSYTPDQLKRETVARWNGGAYHTWNGTAWVRNPNILCDGATGNIGWNMADPDNAGQTAATLRARDKGTYSRGHRNTDEWGYFGVCYADALLR